MNQKEFNEVIIRQTDRCKSMLVAKGAEYAPRAVKNTAVDRLAHFKKAAVVLNTTPRAALMSRREFPRKKLSCLLKRRQMWNPFTGQSIRGMEAKSA